jgi:hypothetical protein
MAVQRPNRLTGFIAAIWKLTKRYSEPQKYDIVAFDFTVSPLVYSLPVWEKKWATAMDRQLAHITWKSGYPP